MPNIEFKAKIKEMRYSDGTLYQRWIPVPATFNRSHCDMHGFRTHPKFGAYANSDMFPRILKRELAARGIEDRIVLEDRDGQRQLPHGVAVADGFLSTVTISL